jgi:uncharacterized protein YggE
MDQNTPPPRPSDESPVLAVNNTPKRRLGRWLILLLTLAVLICLAIIAIMSMRLTTSGDDRTVTVNGEASLQATPDQYVFYPTYTFSNEDKSAALAAMTKKSDEVVAGLKKAGVADDVIKSSSDGNDMPVIYDQVKSAPSYSLRLTVTVKDKALAQKVQDYLLTTTPSGGVSPTVSFSDAKRKTIESQARDEATKDARSKADQSAKNLGFKIGRVKSLTDGAGFNGAIPYAMDSKAVAPEAASTSASAPQLNLQPGQNEVTYSVTVVYEIH